MVAELGTTLGNLLDRGEYPHTGTQITIFAIAVVALLVVGILLWYYSHPRRRKNSGPTDKGNGSED